MAHGGGNIREFKTVPFSELLKLAAGKNVARVGATEKDPKGRAAQYEKEGYSGVMYMFKTENMRKAEDQLLQQGGTHNEQRKSNVQDKPGFVYVIIGRKY